MDRRTFIGAASATAVLPTNALSLSFTRSGLPDVKTGHQKCFVAMTRNKEGRECVFAAYYLNAYPLEYDDCVCKAEDDHDDGCPTTGWFYDNSNFEYENCYYEVSGNVIAWAALPTADDVKASFGA